MAQTYCVQADIEAIIGAASVLATCDDDRSGSLSATEQTYVTSAIERAAVEMNSALENQYVISELSGNDWCKWCNAYLACWYLFSRRSNPVPTSVQEAIADYREKLSESRWGRFQVPEQNPSFEHIPTVSNLKPEIWKSSNPIRVSVEESTGATPEGGRKRNPTDIPGDL